MNLDISQKLYDALSKQTLQRDYNEIEVVEVAVKTFLLMPVEVQKHLISHVDNLSPETQWVPLPAFIAERKKRQALEKKFGKIPPKQPDNPLA